MFTCTSLKLCIREIWSQIHFHCMYARYMTTPDICQKIPYSKKLQRFLCTSYSFAILLTELSLNSPIGPMVFSNHNFHRLMLILHSRKQTAQTLEKVKERFHFLLELTSLAKNNRKKEVNMIHFNSVIY